MNDIEYVKQEETKTELSRTQRFFLTIIIVIECVALCFIVATIVYIFAPDEELPVSSQEAYLESHIGEESRLQTVGQKEQRQPGVVQEHAQSEHPEKSQVENHEQPESEKHEQQQEEDQEIEASETAEADLLDLNLQVELDNQESRVAGAIYPKPDIDPDKPMIALTFDDGPYDPVTNRILDILEKYDARATFFVLGLQLETYGETLKRIYSLGCQIGNHSYNHKYLHSLSVEEIHKEIDNTNNLIREILNIEVKIVRPPYGSPNDYLKEVIPYPLVLWSVDPKDWKSLNKDAIISEVVNKVEDGDIVILHDTYPTTADACEVIIPRLIEDGYQLVTVDELMEYRNISMISGKVYYNAHRK